MRKLYNLRMKESTVVASHFNEFDSLFAQIRAQKMQIDDEMKAATFALLITTFIRYLFYGNQ